MEDWIKEYWLKALFGLIIGAFGFWGRKKIRTIETEIEAQAAMKLGIRALLRNEIKRAYNESLTRGFCSMDDLDNIENMYKQYHGLGGNGPVTRLMEKLGQLPIKPDVD